MFTQAKGNVFNPDDWPVYLSVVVASWAGFLGGTLLRRRADTDAIIRVLLVLVFASSAILLGALETPASPRPTLSAGWRGGPRSSPSSAAPGAVRASSPAGTCSQSAACLRRTPSLPAAAELKR
jgi:hypothetical protein